MKSYNCSDEKSLRLFMSDFYPDWAGNLALAKILCERYMKRVKGGGFSGSGYREKKLSDVKPGEKVVVEVAVLNVEKSSYWGCANKKKGCRDVNWKITNLNIADETMETWASHISDKHLDVEPGDVIKLYGRGKTWRGKVELYIDSVELVARPAVSKPDTSKETGSNEPVVRKKKVVVRSEKPNVENKKCSRDAVIEFLEEAGDVYLDVIESYLKRCNMDMSELDGFIELKKDDNGLWFVRLKKGVVARNA